MTGARRNPGRFLYSSGAAPSSRNFQPSKPDARFLLKLIFNRSFGNRSNDFGLPLHQSIASACLTKQNVTDLRWLWVRPYRSVGSRDSYVAAGDFCRFESSMLKMQLPLGTLPLRSFGTEVIPPQVWGTSRTEIYQQRRKFGECAPEIAASSSCFSTDGIAEGCQRPPQRLLIRSFSPPSVLAAYELDEDFEVEHSKLVRNDEKEVDSKGDCCKASLRIEPLRAGIFDRELRRRRRTQPFSDQQSLGVGLYRDKVRYRRSFNTVASPISTDHKYIEEANGKIEVMEEVSYQNNASVDFQSPVIDVKGVRASGKEACQQDERERVEAVIQEGLISDIDEEETDELNVRGDEDAESHKSDLEWQKKKLLADGVEELEAELKKLESRTHHQDVQIGMACLRLAQVCDAAGEVPHKILHYGKRALQIFGSKEDSVDTSMCLQVIGSAYYKMSEYEKCLSQLERAARILEKMERIVGEWEIRALKYSIQILLGHAKIGLGMDHEALINYQEGLAINERLLEPGHPDLAMSYQQVAEAWLEAGNPQEALDLCTKALIIFQNYFGQDSSQVAIARKLLAMIYTSLENYEKVLEEHEKIRPILEAQGLSNEIASLDLSTSEALVALERHKEAITALENVVKLTKESSRLRGQAFVHLAQANAALKKGKDAVKYCKKALQFLTNSKTSSVENGESLLELASVYQQLNEPEQSLDTLKKALAIFQQFPNQEEAIADAEGQIGALLIFMGKIDEGLQYLTRAAEVFKETYGPDSEELLSVYNHIAIAYLELERPNDAVEVFEKARKISVDTLGPDDSDTLAIYNNLVNAYSILGRLDKAIEYQKHIVETVRSLGDEALDPLDEAEKKLQQLLQEAGSE